MMAGACRGSSSPHSGQEALNGKGAGDQVYPSKTPPVTYFLQLEFPEISQNSGTSWGPSNIFKP
jgi:hypothetical protein